MRARIHPYRQFRKRFGVKADLCHQPRQARRDSTRFQPFSEARETLLLCADSYDLIARWARHFQDNFYGEAPSEPDLVTTATTDQAGGEQNSTMPQCNQSQSTHTKRYGTTDSADSAVDSQANGSADEPLSIDDMAERANQHNPHRNRDSASKTGSATVVVQGQRLTGSLPISRLDIHLQSMAGRGRIADTEDFEVRLHHCKAADFRIVNKAGTLSVANIGTPWDSFSFAMFNPAQWNTGVEVADVEIHSGSMKWDGTASKTFNFECHSGSAQITGLPQGYGYTTQISGSTVLIDGESALSSRPGSPMLNLDLRSNSASVQ
ncbi:hypothetical protein GA0061078_1667 [Bifidobacterium bohemicum]|nr:hypothetical protein GA0061078_1667 [Bifidobacterium bohemicum]